MPSQPGGFHRWLLAMEESDVFVNDSVQPWRGGEQEEEGLRAEQMGRPTAKGFNIGVFGESTVGGDWPQTRTRVLIVLPEPHLKFGCNES